MDSEIGLCRSCKWWHQEEPEDLLGICELASEFDQEHYFVTGDGLLYTDSEHGCNRWENFHG